MNLATCTGIAPPLRRVGLTSFMALQMIVLWMLDPCELLTIAVQAVLVDSGFIIQSWSPIEVTPIALKAHETDTKLLQ